MYSGNSAARLNKMRFLSFLFLMEVIMYRVILRGKFLVIEDLSNGQHGGIICKREIALKCYFCWCEMLGDALSPDSCIEW